ncbi:Serine/threonine-protein kinase BLUS1 [Vitis vinifera]|uniref:Serine/threonine-protein kinase BLUS1 n=1 Tax=Vitis vinifera TaxID=29760 RepID=A0A438JQN2_VITVI|nr:Serine/threonine-protein kinase BLUS1 [Vitis vinifera]
MVQGAGNEPPLMVVTDPQTKNEYRIRDVIGTSNGATVYQADESYESNKATAVAVKILNIKNKDESVDDNLCVVMPFMSFGSLQSLISSRFRNCFSEDCIAIILTETLKGVAHIHRNRHIHKHIDAKNIFLCESSAIRLAFAAAEYDHGQNDTTTALPNLCDWPAPEVQGCCTMSDIWLVGITALQLAFGLRVSTRQGMARMIKMYRKDWDERTQKVGLDPTQRHLPRSFQDMVGMCLGQEQLDRPTASEPLKHDLFKNRGDVHCFFNAINRKRI